MVVESRRGRRLGAVRDRPVDATIIAAANVDLRAAIAAGKFRADLFHRIAAFHIEVPPLRARDADAVLLATRFVVEAGQRYHKAVRALSVEARARVRAGLWPGNVRELRFAVERAVILSPDDAVELAATHLLADLPTSPAPNQAGQAAVRAGSGAVDVDLPPDGISFDELERAILRAALDRAKGNVVQAARLLHLKRDAMRYRVRKLGLVEEEAHGDGDGSKDPGGENTQ
jgi:DNA-binding NtrC family response regulator